MSSRRKFIGTVTTGLAGTLLGAGERVRVGVIGAGDRGLQLAREFAESGAEVAGFADVYKRRLEEAARAVPGAKPHSDYRALLEDKSLDAVAIATPQHLHAGQFIAALEAGKHVYVEKAMAFTVDETRAMRTALERAGRRTVQVGHQWCSSGQMTDAAALLASGRVGRITAIRGYMYRNTPRGKPQWTRPVYPDATPENVAWREFLGEAPERDFDAERFTNWRLYWDYSGGNFFENLSHQLAFWYKALALEIPEAVTARGGVYLWQDGREVPDTMNVAMEHAGGLLFTWDSAFGNGRYGVGEDALGTDGTIARGQQIRYFPEKVNRPAEMETAGGTPTARHAHVRDFLEAIRSGRETNCPFELGRRVSIACRMAVESYRQGRTVRWDARAEAIV